MGEKNTTGDLPMVLTYNSKLNWLYRVGNNPGRHRDKSSLIVEQKLRHHSIETIRMVMEHARYKLIHGELPDGVTENCLIKREKLERFTPDEVVKHVSDYKKTNPREFESRE